MSTDLTRREFVIAASLGAATLLAGADDLTPAGAPPDGPVILFQGDSITDGGRARRGDTPNATAALGAGYPLLVAAAVLRARPERGYRFFNRGVSGDKVPDLQARWEADALALKPDVLSVLVGVNDFWHKKLRGYPGTTETYEAEYAALLAGTKRALPAVRLVVLEPFVMRAGAVDASWFPEFDARRAAAARVARAAGATWVPLQQPFDAAARRTGPAYWAADGIHPTPAGHELIAERWMRAVKL